MNNRSTLFCVGIINASLAVNCILSASTHLPLGVMGIAPLVIHVFLTGVCLAAAAPRAS